MTNLTFTNNLTLKIFDAIENKNKGTLTLKFPVEFYSEYDIKEIFDNKKENYSNLIKSTENGTFITQFENYTKRIFIGTEVVEVISEELKEVETTDVNGNSTTIFVPDSKITEVEVVVTILKYEDPTTQLIEKINQQINPTIDFDICSLQELQKYRQEKNKEAMNDFFRTHPLLHSDGLYYGVEDEDRQEMGEEFLGYMLELESNSNAVLEWHSKGTACTPRTKEEFAAIAIAIRNYTKPYFREMQEAKEAIFSATTKDDVIAVKIFGEK